MKRNLKTILKRIQKGTKAKVSFATYTPIVDNLHAQRKAGFDRLEADVQKYNIAAVSIMKQAGVPSTICTNWSRAATSRGWSSVMARTTPRKGTKYWERQ